MSGDELEPARPFVALEAARPSAALEVLRLDAERMDDFALVHGEANGAGWCHCVAWWVPTWQGWGERSADDNRAFRQRLCQRGEYDGYLLYVDGQPAGWCQVGPRDRLSKLVTQFELAPAPDTWAVTCFFIAPAHRGRGLAAHLLARVIEDVRGRGAGRLEAFPRRAPHGSTLATLDLWNGPEAMFRAAGFDVIRDDPTRPVLALVL